MILTQRLLLSALTLSVVVLTGCGDGPLLTAMKNGDGAEATRLVQEGGKLNQQDRVGKTALHLALEMSDKELFSALLQKGADPNVCDSVGTSVVHAAAEEEDVFWLTEVLSHGGNPNQSNTGNPSAPNSTPIYYAIDANRSATAILLIKAGTDVKHVNSRGSTPLLKAIFGGCYDVAIALIDAGADPRQPLKDSRTVLNSDFCEKENFESICKLEGEDLVAARKLKALLREKGCLTY